MHAATQSWSLGSNALYGTSASPSLRTTWLCWRLTSSRMVRRSASVPSSATMRYWPVVRWRLYGCLSTRPESTVLSATPRPTGTSASCMITLAAPKSADAAIASRARRSISGASASMTARGLVSVTATALDLITRHRSRREQRRVVAGYDGDAAVAKRAQTLGRRRLRAVVVGEDREAVVVEAAGEMGDISAEHECLAEAHRLVAGRVSRRQEQAHGPVAEQVVVAVDEDDLLGGRRIIARVEEVPGDRRVVVAGLPLAALHDDRHVLRQQGQA